MESDSAPKKRGPKPGTKYARTQSSSSDEGPAIVTPHDLLEATLKTHKGLADRIDIARQDISSTFVRYMPSSGDIARRVGEEAAGPYFLILALVMFTFLASLGSCIQTSSNGVQDSMLPYPSKGQTCIVQDNTIAGCFADVE